MPSVDTTIPPSPTTTSTNAATTTTAPQHPSSPLNFVENPAHRSDGADEVPMSYDEKWQLSFDMNRLAGYRLGKIAQIVQQREPQFVGLKQEDMEIDLETLTTSTLREIQKYVSECLSPQS